MPSEAKAIHAVGALTTMCGAARAAAGLLVVAFLVAAVAGCGSGAKETGTAAPTSVQFQFTLPSATAPVTRLHVRLPDQTESIGPDTEGLFTTDGSDLYYVGPSGRFAIQPIPMLRGPAAPVGANVRVRATAEVAGGQRRMAGPYPDETLLFDADGTIYIAWAGELRPVTIGRVERSTLQGVSVAGAPLHLVPVD